MIREEQIKKQADIYTDDASNYAEWSDDGGWSETNDIELVEKAFVEGAKWADKHPNLSEEELEIIWQKKHLIEKACNWLDINFPTTDYSGSWYKEGFIKQFKKAMEE